MLTLHLFRHGETHFNAEGRIQGQFDSELNETGIAQATDLRTFVATLGINAAYSSSNLRASQTANLLTEGLNLEITLIDDLREISLGPLERTMWREVAESHPEQFTNFMTTPDQFRYEGAETFQELQQRGVAAIESIMETESTNGSSDVLVVSHGAILKTIVAHYCHVPLANMWQDPSLKNCSHSTLVVDDAGTRRIATLGSTDVAGTVWETTS